MSRVIVTIHGTGRTACNFGDSQMQALAVHLSAAPHHRPVWWGDLIDHGSFFADCGNRLSDWYIALSRRLNGRSPRFVPRLVWHAADRLHRLVDGLAGIVAYFLRARMREVIRGRLRQTLAELSRHRHEIVLISESLGSLVAFDVLRAEADRYNIAAWFTLGCPLRTLVRTGQRSVDLGAINRATVKQWFNLYAPRDLVAAPIASLFPGYPIRDERISGSRGYWQSHHYWSNPHVAELIARALRVNEPI